MVETAYSRISCPAGASSSLVCVVALQREGDQGEFGRVGVGEESDPHSLLSFSKGVRDYKREFSLGDYYYH